MKFDLLQVLLITSRRHADCWIVPGGGIEYNENAKDAAEREVYEEAGVQGSIRRLLGIYEVDFKITFLH